MERPSWEEYYKSITEISASRSTCKRLKVGCIFVKDNRIISQSYNGFISGMPHNSIIVNGHELGTIHAEENSLIYCAKYGISCKGSIAYITHYPCLNCVKHLYMAGIKEIRYINDYNNDDNIKKLGLFFQNSNEGMSIKKVIV
jgi:dCMP deaminase|tara:strand:+ start:4557 stop:4985 length:429 start_codon:yes stop_codon:yes gene_type:complete